MRILTLGYCTSIRTVPYLIMCSKPQVLPTIFKYTPHFYLYYGIGLLQLEPCQTFCKFDYQSFSQSAFLQSVACRRFQIVALWLSSASWILLRSVITFEDITALSLSSITNCSAVSWFYLIGSLVRHVFSVMKYCCVTKFLIISLF